MTNKELHRKTILEKTEEQRNWESVNAIFADYYHGTETKGM